jgi:NHLM bacteriocin system ABC transporter ATP-binding protein
MPLPAPGRAVLIEAGALDVFGRRTLPDGQVSRRVHVARVAAGGALPSPTAPPPEGLDLIAVALPDTRVRDVDLDETCKRTGDGSAPLDAWFAAVAENFTAQPLAGAARSVDPDRREVVAGGTVLAASTPAWIVADVPALRLPRPDGVNEGVSSDLAFAAGPLWVEAETETTVEALSSVADRPARRDDMLAQTEHRLFDTLASRVDMQHRRAADRADAIARIGADALAAGSRVIGAVLVNEGPSELATISVVDPIESAFARIVDHFGRRAELPKLNVDENDPLALIRELAAVNRLRYRPVKLTGHWQRQAGLPLIVFHDGVPLALIPHKDGSFRLYESGSTAPTRLTAARAKDLSRQAYAIYDTLPERATASTFLKLMFDRARSDLGRMFALTGIMALLSLLTPLLASQIIGEVVPNANMPYLQELILLLIAAAVGSGIFQIARAIIIVRLEKGIQLWSEAGLWDRLLRLPRSFYRRFSTGDVVARLFGLETIRITLSGPTVSAVVDGFSALTNIAVMFLFSWSLGLAGLAFGIFAFVVLLAINLRQLPHYRRLYRAQGEMTNRGLETLYAIGKLRVAGAESRAFSRWAASFAEKRAHDFRVRRLEIFSYVFNLTLPALGMLLFFAVYAFLSSDVGTGAFVGFFVAFSQFVTAFMNFGNAVSSSLLIFPTWRWAEPLIETRPEREEGGADPGILSGSIGLGNVDFGYADKQVLHDVSFQIRPGTFVAIVGPSGAGKSTLVNLMLGLETPTAGSVTFDGRDLSGLDRRLVRRQFGVVLQDDQLIPGSILQNIVGTSNLTREDAERAVAMVGLEDDVDKMPMGLHTIISEESGDISGGQRQRILLARAMVRKPRLLFLDEATSALDNRTQAIVSRSLEQLQATRIVVAHRLSTIKQADRILVFERGRLVEDGGYQELLDADGLFRRLVSRQLL